MVIFSTYMLMKATFKGSGDMTWFIFVTLLSFLIRLFLTVGFAHIIGMGMIWWSICAGWIISLGVTVGRYVQGGWKNKRIDAQ